jgi:phosphatidate cytidylyltransferase
MAPWIYLQLFGCGYFGWYAAAIFSLIRPEVGWRGIFPLLLVQLAVATADTGAYVTGRAFGKRKLAPTISSGKTVEGAIGGAVLTTILVMAIGPILLNTGGLVNLGLGLVLSCTAILGDLFISILKRHAGAKDSSHLIPGHGGVLDRFDALLFSAPVAAFYLSLFGL